MSKEEKYRVDFDNYIKKKELLLDYSRHSRETG